MSLQKKEHDMLLALMSKQDANSLDFAKSGMNIDNTQLLQKEEYKTSEFIKKSFTDQNGKFNELAFNTLHDMAQRRFAELAEEKTLDDIASDLEYGNYALFVPEGAKRRDITPKGRHYEYNPLNQSIGIEGDYWSDPEITVKEAAQQNRIYDPINKKWLEETAQSRSLLKKAFGEPLVYARYVKDTTVNPITGKTGNFKKGDFILDENNQYFTMLAGNLDIAAGHEVVKLQDILSDEGSWANRNLDFFDADGLYKSPVGVAAKAIVSVLPYLGPVWLKVPYTILNIMIGLGQNLPQFIKAFDGISNNNRYTELSEECNRIANYFERYRPSITDAGKNKFFSFENLGNLLTDTVHQLYGQRQVAALSKYIKSVPKEAASLSALRNKVAAEKASSRAAQLLSLSYMTLVSTGDVYNQAINGGYDARTAGLATLAAAAGMFGVMNLNALGGLSTWMLGKEQGFYRNATRAASNKVAKADLDDLFEATKQFVVTGNKKSAGKLKTAALKVGQYLDQSVRLGMEGFYKNMLTEGIEEVTEEAVVDAVKGLADGLSYLGFKTSDHNGSFGGWKNVFSKQGLERYLQVFAGGALGGGVFHGIETKVDPFFANLWGDPNAPQGMKDADYDIVDLYFEGRLDEYIDELESHVSKFVPDQLMVLPDENGNPLPTTEKAQSQRQFVVNELVSRAKTLKSLLDSWMRTANLDSVDSDIREYIKQSLKPFIKNTMLVNQEGSSEKIVTVFQKKFANDVKHLLDLQKDFKSKEDFYNKEGLSQSDKEAAKVNRDVAKAKYEKALATMQSYLKGESYVKNHWIGQLLINKEYLKWLSPNKENLSIQTFYKNFYGDNTVNFEDLTPQKKADVEEAYNLLVQNNSDLDNFLSQADVLYETVAAISDIISPHISTFLGKARNQLWKQYMNVEEDVIKEALISVNYEEMLQELFGDVDMDKLNEQEKQQYIQSARYAAILSAISPQQMVKLIQSSPQSFSLMERFSMDYASIVKEIFSEIKTVAEDGTEQKISFSSLDGKTQKIIESLINSTFANNPVHAYTSDQVLLLFQDTINKIYNDPIWSQAIWKSHYGEDFTPESQKIELPWTNDDTVMQDIANKLNQAKTALWNEISQDGILEDFYDDIVEYKQSVIEYIQNEIAKLEAADDQFQYAFKVSKSESGIKAISIQPGSEANISVGLMKIITMLATGQFVSPSIVSPLKNVLKLAGINFDSIVQQLTVEEAQNLNQQAVIEQSNAIVESLQNYFNELSTMPTQKIDNSLRNAILQIAISTGASNSNAQKISDFIFKSIKTIRDGKADAQAMIFPKDLEKQIEHIKTVLNMIQTVGKMMAPVMMYDENGEYTTIDGFNKVRRDFTASMGGDTSNIHLMSVEEFELFASIIGQLKHKLEIISTVKSQAEHDMNAQFEAVRSHMIQNSNIIYRQLNSIGTQRGDDEEEQTGNTQPSLFSFSEEDLGPEPSVQDSLETKLTWNLQYRSLLQDRFSKILSDKEVAKQFGIEPEEGVSTLDALVQYIVEHISNVVVDENNGEQALTLHQYGSDAVTASGGADSEVDIRHVEIQYLLIDIISLIQNQNGTSNPTIQKLHQTIYNSIKQTQDTEDGKSFYPRQDQIYAIELALASKYSSQALNTLVSYIVDKGNEDDAVSKRRQIHNYVRIPGPAGSGKTALWNIYIDALKALDPNIKLVCTAHTDMKTKELKQSIDSESSKNIKFGTLYDIFPGLQDYQDTAALLEEELLTAIQVKEADFIAMLQSDTPKTTTKSGKEIDWTADENFAVGTIKTNTVAGKVIEMSILVPKKGEGFDLETSSTRFNVSDASIVSLVETLDLTDTLKNGVLLLDECTNLSTLEAQVLNALSLKYNFLILATGDHIQEGYSIKYGEGQLHTVGDEDFIGINIPSLKSIHRAHNTGQQEMWSACRKLFHDAAPNNKTFLGLADYTINDDQDEDNPTGQLKIKKDSQEVTITYTTTNDQHGFLGSLFITNNDENLFNRAIESIKNKDTQTVVGIVSSESNKEILRRKLEAAGFKSENIKVELVTNIKGTEADYAIAYNIEAFGMASHHLQRLYTMSTRGKKGFIGISQDTWDVGFSYVEGSVSLVNTVRSASDAGVEWMGSYQAAISAIRAAESEQNGSEEIPEEIDDSIDPEEEETQTYDTEEQIAESEDNAPDNPSQDKKEKIQQLSNTYAAAFGEDTIMPLHPIGFRTGQTVETLRALKNISIAEAGTHLQPAKGDMYAVWKLLSSWGTISPFIDSRDRNVIGAIVEYAARTYTTNFLNAYIYTINSLREAYYKGDLTAIGFLKTKYNQATDHAFLKPNDEDGQYDNIYRLGLPVFGEAEADTELITLFTVGYINTTTEKQASDIASLWKQDKIVLKQKRGDIQDILDRFTAYFDTATEKARADWYPRKKYKGGLQPVTGARPAKLKTGLSKNIDLFYPELHSRPNLGKILHYLRPKLDKMLDLGWEIVSNAEFVVDPMDRNLDANFTDFVNRYRKVPLTKDDVLKKFAGILKHKGIFKVIRPIGRTDCDTFVYINQTISWVDWANKAFYKGTRTFGRYATFQLLSGLSGKEFNVWSKYILTRERIKNAQSLDELVTILKESPEWQLVHEALSEETQLSPEQREEFETHLLYSTICAVLKTHFPFVKSENGTLVQRGTRGLSKINNWTSESRQKGFTKERGHVNPFLSGNVFLLTNLNNNKPNYIYTSIDDSSQSIEQYIGFVYEQERALLDLEAFEDYQSPTNSGSLGGKENLEEGNQGGPLTTIYSTQDAIDALNVIFPGTTSKRGGIRRSLDPDFKAENPLSPEVADKYGYILRNYEQMKQDDSTELRPVVEQFIRAVQGLTPETTNSALANLKNRYPDLCS